VTVELRPLSPLADRAAAFEAMPPTVRVRELPLVTQVNVRLDPSGPAAAAVADVLGAPLPTEPGHSVLVAGGAHRLLWLGPDEWLVVTSVFDGAALASVLRAAVGDAPAAITDVSAQRTILRLAGADACTVLAKGCSIDLRPRTSPRGTCVQTLLAQTGVIIVVDGDHAEDFLLLVRSSFAAYLAAWLVDAAIDLD
jgi:sarcosine oxidase subunit gamma